MSDNPVTKPYCKDCKYYEPIGFYGWERKMYPEDNQMKLSDFIQSTQEGLMRGLKTQWKTGDEVFAWWMDENINQMKLSDFMDMNQEG